MRANMGASDDCKFARAEAIRKKALREEIGRELLILFPKVCLG